MKKLILTGLMAVIFMSASKAQQFEYKVVTSIESVVPMGMGRSRIIAENQPSDYKKLTTARTDGKESDQEKVDRSDVKIQNFEETKLLNFFSGVGINFQNVASNDAVIGSKINEMIKEGWELAFVTSGVESVGGKDDHYGIFITRYIFRKKI